MHVVRSDMAEDATVAALMEWVEEVQQEPPKPSRFKPPPQG